MLEQRFADVLVLVAASKAMQIEVLMNLTAFLQVLPGRVPSNNHGRVQFADEANYVARACLVHKPGICATLCNKVKACWLVVFVFWFKGRFSMPVPRCSKHLNLLQ